MKLYNLADYKLGPRSIVMTYATNLLLNENGTDNILNKNLEASGPSLNPTIWRSERVKRKKKDNKRILCSKLKTKTLKLYGVLMDPSYKGGLASFLQLKKCNLEANNLSKTINYSYCSTKMIHTCCNCQVSRQIVLIYTNFIIPHLYKIHIEMKPNNMFRSLICTKKLPVHPKFQLNICVQMTTYCISAKKTLGFESYIPVQKNSAQLLST